MPAANTIDLKKKIESALHEFSIMPLPAAARNLFQELGYASQRDENILQIATPSDFLQWLESANQNNVLSDKDRVELQKHLKYLHFIFQLTDVEIRTALGGIQESLFDSKTAVDGSRKKSYLVFAASLSTDAPGNRSTLARLVRLINKPLPMPAIILFRHEDTLTIGVINRRDHKRAPDRDVLEKVTLIKDISIAEPNRAHVEILHDLTLATLIQKHRVENFDSLHDAWRKTLDISALNRKFYKELFNWYLFAVKTVRFPNPDKQPEEVNNSINVIRLLTRLIFCWFIKEKGLIPESLFNERKVRDILSDQASKDGSAYYKAILQNLFFATLNTEMNHYIPGSRRFISEHKNDRGVNPDYNNFTVYRHKSLFNDSNAALKLFDNIPFLNGGLFECLDTIETGNGKNREIRYDGFSSTPSKQPSVPDFLFFGRMEDVDLSSAYNGKTGGHETVIGLIDVLNSYKFTIMENTPLEEEVALDPELLGKVFENLLASYNPETRSTARNQTGSFYTPREIVNYMVDESLKSYLIGKLNESSPFSKITSLFSYEDTGNPFSLKETDELINALSNAKILDPACGSGAFPMGVLHRMVHILGKLDPNNRKWKQAQLDIVEQDRQKALEMQDDAVRQGAIKSVEERKAYIEASFESSHHELDYLRKLFLIENCIYGVDIQNIAVQIAKLRFFISLIVEQKRDDTKSNLGILAMPNLETKFVAADTLIGLEKPEQINLETSGVGRAEFELKQVRKKIFYARNYYEKKQLRKQEKLKRNALELALKKSWGEVTAKQVAAWNPFDVSGSAPFFDPEMMFGLTMPLQSRSILKFGEASKVTSADKKEIEGAFDIVIGNPPYVQIQSFSGRPEQKAWEKQKYETYTKTGDIYCLFYERGFNLLARGGILAYISSNKWMRANYGTKLRKFFAGKTSPKALIDFGGFKVFDAATVDTSILILKKEKLSGKKPALQAVWMANDFTTQTDIAEYVDKKAVPMKELSSESWIISSVSEYAVRKRIEEMGIPLKKWDITIYRGILTGLNEAFIINGKKKDELIAQDPKSAEIIKPVLRGRDVQHYKVEFADLWLINTHNGYGNVARVNVEQDYPAILEHLQRVNKKTNGGVEKRQDQGDHWSNLRSCAYVADFEKEKLVYPETTVRRSEFYYDNKFYYLDKTCFFIRGNSLKFLNGVLASKLIEWYLEGILRLLGKKSIQYSKQYIENLPVPKLDPPSQIPYEILVDCVLFAHENGLTSDASTLEWVINVMIYGLYFEKEMKKDHCYINDRVAEVVKPFKPGDTDAFKAEYVKSLALFCLKDKGIYHGMIHSRNVEPVRIIHGEKK
ncbi:MAG: Eco57I restriction-modification methylase domain-containing protein [Proteobacteria bacterium]|nr:Eco57I restriction-modification methylase domain-containing protein [Pseudomonadota bacterium]